MKGRQKNTNIMSFNKKKEYAVRDSIKEDRRINLISLTDKGRNAFEEHHWFHMNLTEQMISALADEEIKKLLKYN